jgi:murein DD-endopeptidase MepM/ murein hydrolase activator NlpD
MHNGLDVKVYIGDTIVAAFDGKVRMVKTEGKGYGKYVVIRHHNGLETIYGHLSKQLVAEDQEVKAGEVIGLGGNTGRSYGSHLHFEIRFLGMAIDPALMFNFFDQDIVTNTYVFTKNGERDTKTKNSLVGNEIIQYYKIKQGDTLSGIAQRHGISLDMLCKLNRMTKQIVIRPGQILRCS